MKSILLVISLVAIVESASACVSTQKNFSEGISPAQNLPDQTASAKDSSSQGSSSQTSSAEISAMQNSSAPIHSRQIAFAQIQQSSEDTHSMSEFFTVDDDQEQKFTAELKNSINPLSLGANFFSKMPSAISELGETILSLVLFDHHSTAKTEEYEPYRRQDHFGSWIHDKKDGACYNTRARVLIRDSKTPVQMNEKSCTVTSGTWEEPYTGRVVTQASEIQIDHFVPLKNAYISGAYKWNSQKRCLYANFMGNEFHLLSVDGRENARKGDRTPDRYMPPNRQYSCQYLAQWLKVKLIWKLALNPTEKEKIIDYIEQNNCELSYFVLSLNDLIEQRNYMRDNISLCH